MSPPPVVDPPIPVAAKDQAALEKYVGHCYSLARYQSADVLVVESFTGEKQLWVSPHYGGYRNAWIAAFGPVVSGHDVDHIYSKNRGKMYGYGYVRCALVDSKANQRSGEFESLMGKVFEANKAFHGNQAMQAQEIRYADPVQEAKLKHLAFKPKEGYAPLQRQGQAILSGSRLVGKTTRLTPQPGPQVAVPLKPVSTTPPTAATVKPQLTPVPLKPSPPVRQFQVTAVTLRRMPTSNGIEVVTGTKSYNWSASVVEWIMSGLITAANYKRTQEKLDKILERVGPHLPKNGGVLIATVYEQPNNAAQYGYSTELFLYAYVLGIGATPQEAYQRYLAETSRPDYATLSPAARKNWSKVEHHVWIRSEDR
ncbi:hypothetical protein [Corallococcus exercitus]|uniref:hypothetical protein n=1 Tax=Corallococcus exercitus TaxID=2316736 RepID=UPI0035D4949D